MPLFKKNKGSPLKRAKCKICPKCKGCVTHKKPKYIEVPRGETKPPKKGGTIPPASEVSLRFPREPLEYTSANGYYGVAHGYLMQVKVMLREYRDQLGRYYYTWADYNNPTPIGTMRTLFAKPSGERLTRADNGGTLNSVDSTAFIHGIVVNGNILSRN